MGPVHDPAVIRASEAYLACVSEVVKQLIVSYEGRVSQAPEPLFLSLSQVDGHYNHCLQGKVAHIFSLHRDTLQVALNLNKLTAEVSRKRKLPVVPKLMDIIAAVPEEYRQKLLPYIKSKPVRTASGNEMFPPEGSHSLETTVCEEREKVPDQIGSA